MRKLYPVSVLCEVTDQTRNRRVIPVTVLVTNHLYMDDHTVMQDRVNDPEFSEHVDDVQTQIERQLNGNQIVSWQFGPNDETANPVEWGVCGYMTDAPDKIVFENGHIFQFAYGDYEDEPQVKMTGILRKSFVMGEGCEEFVEGMTIMHIGLAKVVRKGSELVVEYCCELP